MGKVTSDNTDDSHTRVFDARIAAIESIGLKGAIIIHQIQYWIDVFRQQAAGDEAIREKHYINGKWWIYNTYEQWQAQFPFMSMSTIKREFQKLIRVGVVIVGCYNLKGYDRTKWYTISDEILESLVLSHSVKMTHCIVSKGNNAKCQDDTTNTKEYTKTTTKEYKDSKRDFSSDDAKIFPSTPKESAYDYQILKRQLSVVCNGDDKSDKVNYCYAIIKYYVNRYKDTQGEEHPHIGQTTIRKAVEFLVNGSEVDKDLSVDEWEILIDKYFDTSFTDCDYHINHFLSPNIINNRFYEELY